MSDFSKWLFQLVKDIFAAVWDFCGDAVIWLFEQILLAIAQTIQLIIVPCFMSGAAAGAGLSSLFAKVSPAILYFVSFINFPALFAMFSCAIIFVFTRKLITLFQW